MLLSLGGRVKPDHGEDLKCFGRSVTNGFHDRMSEWIALSGVRV